MIRIREIDHLVLRVVDLDAMLRFYCDVLGCRLERRVEAFGLVQLRAGRSLIDLVTMDGKLGRAGGAPPGREGRNVDHFCVRVQPFNEAAIRRRLAAAGLEAGPIEQRYGAEGAGPSIYVNDPEGNVVELKGPPAKPVRAAMRKRAAKRTARPRTEHTSRKGGRTRVRSATARRRKGASR